MKGEGHRDWENVIGSKYIHTIFARNEAMIEHIYIYIPYDPTQFGLK